MQIFLENQQEFQYKASSVYYLSVSVPFWLHELAFCSMHLHKGLAPPRTETAQQFWKLGPKKDKTIHKKSLQSLFCEQWLLIWQVDIKLQWHILRQIRANDLALSKFYTTEE